MNEAEEAKRLLDNGYVVLVFRNGCGDYEALAVPEGESVDDARRAWEEHEPAEGVPIYEWAFDGPHRFCGGGDTVAHALHAVAEKVLLRQLPDRDPETGELR